MSLLDLEETNEFDAPGTKTVTHRNPDRKNSKQRIITHVLSKEMLPPVTKRKVAVYQVINAYRKDPLLAGNATGDDILPFDVVIPGTYMIYDPHEMNITQRQKMMKNVTRPGIEIKDGRQISTEVVEDIVLYKGLLEVNQESAYPLYVLMELHPLNGSNKRRNKDVQPVFERVDMKYRSVASLDALEDLAEEASRTIKDLKIDEVMGFLATLKLPTAGIRADDARYNLRMYAKQNPLAFFKLNPSSTEMIKINFLDALELGFLEYDLEKKGYRFTTENKPFFTHAIGEEPVMATVKFLASQKGVDIYTLITEYLGFWE